MVVTNALGQLIGLKRQREASEREAKARGGQQMGQIFQQMAQMKTMKDQQDEEKRRYDEQTKMKQQEMRYKQTMESTARYEKAKEQRLGLAIDTVKLTGIAPTQEELQAIGVGPGIGGYFEKLATQRSREMAYDRARQEEERLNRELERAVAQKKLDQMGQPVPPTEEERANIERIRADADKKRAEADALREELAGQQGGRTPFERLVRKLPVIGETAGDVIGGKLPTGTGGVSQNTVYTRTSIEEMEQQRQAWREAESAAEKKETAQKWYRSQMAALQDDGYTLDDLAEANPDLLRELGSAARDAGNKVLTVRILNLLEGR